MNISKLKTLHMSDPLGIDVNPYFSWIIESDARDIMQSAYRIVVAEPSGTIAWDTGKVESDNSAFISYAGDPLKSCAAYTWTASVWDNQGHQAAASAKFETAFIVPSDWQAQWIKSPFRVKKRRAGFAKQAPATMFRKAFSLKEQPAQARLYATCHGIYQVSINGVPPDEREFAPEHTVYRDYLCYQTYDITRLLQNGENVLGMHVGDGWYCGPNTKPDMADYEPVHAVLFQLEVIYADGSREVINSDSHVKTSQGAVLSSDLFAGELFDANLLQPGWDRPGFDDKGWRKGIPASYGYKNLVAQLGQPVRSVATIPAIKVTTSPKGEKIVDFGQVLAGRVRARIHAPRGTRVTLDHFETVDQYGNYFKTIQGNIPQRDIYISDGREVVFEPLFTFHGFRYVRVSGLDEVRAEDFSAIALSTEMENLGTFECSNADLNRLYENTRWSQRSNMLSIPTDCPQREKAGWTGDIQIYATTALLNEDVTPFLTRWMRNLTCDQYENGGVPFVVPNVSLYKMLSKLTGWLFHNDGPAASAGWGDAAVLVPYFMYQVTGNTDILHQQYDSMKKWCDYVITTARSKRARGSKLPDGIEQYLWNTGFHFGEWLIPSLSTKGYGSGTFRSLKDSLKYIAPIYGYFSMTSMAEIARVLGNAADAQYYGDISLKIKDAIGKGVIDQDGNMPVELMGAYVLPLYFDLVPEKFRQHFADRLVKMIEENGGCLDTGFLGTPFLMDALCKIERTDLAYAILYQDKCPSWLYEVKNGATSIWESWYAYKEDGTPIVMSLNHYAFGCVDDWIFRYINGIDKTKPGFKHILIQPEPDQSLTYARRTFRSEYGDIVSDWKVTDGKFQLDVAIPCNTTATVVLPDGTHHELGSGRYNFSCQI